MAMREKLRVPIYQPAVLDQLVKLDIDLKWSDTEAEGAWSYDQSTLNYTKPRDAVFNLHFRVLSGTLTGNGGAWTWTGTKLNRWISWIFTPDSTFTSCKGVLVENNTNCLFRVEIEDSGSTQLVLRSLEPGEKVFLQGAREIAGLMASGRVHVHGPIMDSSVDSGDMFVGRSVATDTGSFLITGTVTVTFKSALDLTTIMLLSGGIAFLGDYTIEEKGLNDLLTRSSISGLAGRVAGILESTLAEFLAGYGATLITGLAIGWVTTADIMDFRFHKRVFEKVLQNPLTLAPLLTAIAGDDDLANLAKGLGTAGFSVGSIALLSSDEYHIYPGQATAFRYDSAAPDVNILDDQPYKIVIEDYVVWENDATTLAFESIATATYESAETGALPDFRCILGHTCLEESKTLTSTWKAYATKKIESPGLTNLNHFDRWVRRIYLSDTTKDAYIPSGQTVVVQNVFNVDIWIGLYGVADSAPTTETDKTGFVYRLRPNESLVLPYDVLQHIRCIDVIYFEDIIDTYDILAAPNTTDETLEIMRPGYIDIFVDMKSGISPFVLASAAGGVFAAVLPYEKLVKSSVFKDLNPYFKKIAAIVGDTAAAVAIGYATAWSFSIGLGWKNPVDLLDLTMHQEVLAAALRNPATLTLGLPALASFLPSDISQRIATGGAAAGFTAAVLGSLQVIKRFWQYE